MFTKTKIGIITLLLISFVVGGFAFNAYQIGAVENGKGNGHPFGFWKWGFGEIDIDIDSEEWQAKIEEWKAKMEETKASGEWEGKGYHFGRKGMLGMWNYNDEINYEITELDNGIQITITSDNLDIVQKLKDYAAKMKDRLGE